MGFIFIGFGEVFYLWIFKKESFTPLDYVFGSVLGLLFLGWQSFPYLREIGLSKETRGRELVFSGEKLLVAASVLEGSKKEPLLWSNSPYYDLPWAKRSRINVTSPMGNRNSPCYALNLKNGETLFIRRSSFYGMETKVIDLFRRFAKVPISLEGDLR